MPIRESIANSCIALGLSIAAVATALFGIALVNFMMLLALIGVLVHPRSSQILKVASWPGVAWLSLGLFGWLALSWSWSDGAVDQKSEYLRAYREFLLIPVFAVALSFSGTRQVLWNLMFWSLAVSVFVTYLLWLNWIQIDGASLSIKNRIFYGVSTSVFMYWALLRAEAGGGVFRLAMVALALLALFSLLFIETGRTGYVLTASLLGYWIYGLTHGRWTLRVMGVAVLMGALITSYLISDNLERRVDQSINNTVAYFEHGKGSSIGYRLEFYRVSLLAMKGAPIAGHGVGSFRDVHGALVDPARPWGKTDNPHQEYLLIGVQAGFIGVALFIAVLLAAWIYAGRLAPDNARLLRGGILALAISCLFNSSLLDSGDGSFFTLFLAAAFAKVFGCSQQEPAL